MASNSLREMQLHLAATGTGSLFIRTQGTPYLSIQITKTTASQTGMFELYASNAHENPNTMKPPGWNDTGAINSSTRDWVKLDELVTTGSATADGAVLAFTGSSLASKMTNLGQVSFRWLEVRGRSDTGGVFLIRPWSKD